MSKMRFRCFSAYPTWGSLSLGDLRFGHTFAEFLAIVSSDFSSALFSLSSGVAILCTLHLLKLSLIICSLLSVF